MITSLCNVLNCVNCKPLLQPPLICGILWTTNSVSKWAVALKGLIKFGIWLYEPPVVDSSRCELAWPSLSPSVLSVVTTVC